MKQRLVYLFCLITTFVFGITFAQGYSPPNLANAAYTNGPFSTTPNLVGQCTWYCYGRIQEVGLISSNQLASTSVFRGNASSWVADAVAAGFSTNSTPQVGALAVWNTAGLDHVAFVETVSGSTITVTECNNTPTPGANVVVGAASNLRSTMDTSSSGNILWTMPQFTVMYVLGGPFTTNINSYQWFQLTDGSYTGYVAWLDLVPSQPATPLGFQWNITQFKNSAASPWWASVSPTYIYFSQVQYTITDLGTLGGNYSCPGGINDSGQVVGWSYVAGGSTNHAFLYSGNGPMQDLGTLDSTRVYSTALDINNNGQIVGWSWSDSVSAHAFLCSGSSAMKDLGTLSGSDSWASSINDSGQIVGEADLSDGDYRAFLYSGSGPMKSIGSLGGSKSSAVSINNSGQIVGWSWPTGGGSGSGHAFLYSGSGPMQDLGTLGGVQSQAAGINDSGQIVGYSYTSSGATNAFLYEGSGPMQDLGTLGGAISSASSINNNGQVVGDSYTSSGKHHAFLYSGSGPVQDLNNLIPPSSGWTLISNSSINRKGQIACLGKNASGQSHALLLSPIISLTGFGVRTNQFEFTITGTPNLVIVVDACTNLANTNWSPVSTNTLTGGSSYFSNPRWTDSPGCFYRLRSP
jgi:probable HAF family extracellular repeat protein